MRYLISGAAGFLGVHLAKELSAAGQKVMGIDRSMPKERNFFQDFELVDLTDKTRVRVSVEELIERNGGVDCLINMAAVRPAGYFDPSAEYQIDVWEQVLEVNLTSNLLVSQAALNFLHHSTNASIINFSSIYGIRGPRPFIYGEDAFLVDSGDLINTPVSYSATKAAVIGITRHLAIEWAKFGVRVNAIAPGGVKHNQSEAFIARYESITPAGRMGTPEDLVGAISFLSSESSKYVTGTILPIDGGWSL